MRRLLFAPALLILMLSSIAMGTTPKTVALFAAEDAGLLLSPGGSPLISIHTDASLVPASTLKLITSLAALHILGPGYRFPTDVSITSQGDLVIKGYGDPLFITEVLIQLAGEIKAHLPEGKKSVRNIFLNDSYFAAPIFIPGVSASTQPYDAPNGALCANFNSISFRRTSAGDVISGEADTPLSQTALNRVKRTNVMEGRIPLSPDGEEISTHAGELLRHFIMQAGIPVTGEIHVASSPLPAQPLLSFRSPFTLSEIITKLLAHSNNFMANQLFLSMGAKVYGPPATREKGIQAVAGFASEKLSLQLQMVEGSGISRENRISPKMMAKVLNAFSPYRALMRHEKDEWYKTGTLTGVSTRAGFLQGQDGRLYPYVVMLNASSQNMARIMALFRNRIQNGAVALAE